MIKTFDFVLCVIYLTSVYTDWERNTVYCFNGSLSCKKIPYILTVFFSPMTSFYLSDQYIFEIFLFYLFGFYVTFNTVQVISRRVVFWAEETSTSSWPRFCTVNCPPSVYNYQLSHLRFRVWTADLSGGSGVGYHWATAAPEIFSLSLYIIFLFEIFLLF